MRIIVLVSAMLMSGVCMAQVYFPFKQGNRYGYIDTVGKWIIQPVFDHATFFNGNKALANKGDSVFTVSLNGEIRQVAQIKSFISFGQSFALLNKDGKWALSDTSLIAATSFKFNRIDTCGGFFKAMDADNLWSLYDRSFKLKLPNRFEMIAALTDGLFLCRSKDESHIYKLIGDSLKLLRSGNFICKFDNPGFEIFSKKSKKKMYLNANGDSILSCSNCEIISKIENLKVIQNQSEFVLYDFNTGNKIASSKIDTGIMAYNSFYWVAADSLYCRPGSSPVKINEQIDGFLTVSESCNIFFRNNSWGILGLDGTILLKPIYAWIVPLEKDVYRLFGDQCYLYDLGTQRIFKKIDWNAEVGFVGSSIMVTYNDTTELLKYDTAFNLIDSNSYYKVKFMKAGLKTSDFNNNNPLGNNSASNRYFYFREKYGLLSLNNDTLIKAIFLSVSKVNDSLDMVSLQNNNMATIMTLGNSRLACNRRFGILNNRTGKFLVNPDYFYISMAEFKDSNFNVFRVLSRSRKFGLINKSNFELDKSTLCDYISVPENRYFRLFNGLKIYLRTNRRYIYLKNAGFDFGFLTEFNYFGNVFSNEQGRVMGYAKSVNLCNQKGELILSESQAKKNIFVEGGYNGTFIFNLNFDSTGVFDSTGNTIVKPSYKSIRRLKQDKRYFLLYTYDSKFGYLNKEGEEITIAKYKKAFNYSDGYAWCQFKDSMILLDSIGNESDLGIKNSQVIKVSEGYTSYRKKKGWVLIDLNGEIISDDYYKKLYPFINGTAAAQAKGGWG
ncbi:MAG TPA: WG repeat-containing protein, partial [Bacteroidia bacterium]